jgi:hypothetical protein
MSTVFLLNDRFFAVSRALFDDFVRLSHRFRLIVAFSGELATITTLSKPTTAGRHITLLK